MKRLLTINEIFAPSAWRLGGAVRRAAMMLAVMMLTAATAWAADITQNTAVVINSSNKATYNNKSITGTVPSSSSVDPFTSQEHFYSPGAIVVDGIELNLTIDGFTADYRGSYSPRSAISLAHGATLHLTVLGSNYLRGGYGGAGIAVPDGCTLEITSASTGTLTAIGGADYGGGAGIGSRGSGHNLNNINLCPQGCGDIIINGGTINATGGTFSMRGTPTSGAAGIGSSEYSGSCINTIPYTDATYVNNVTGNITINGGIVNATSGYMAAAIGGGLFGTVETIAITGGQITTTEDDISYAGAAIGCGYMHDKGQDYVPRPTITISGGTVTANGSIGGSVSDAGHYTGGSIALSYTNLTDAIHASAYDAATVTLGSDFMLQGTQTAATTANIGGRTIVPKVTVSFNANGHGTAPAAMATAYGSKINAPTVSEVPSYALSGWYKESSCTNQWNFSSDVVTSNITLYAKWVTDPGYITGSGTVNNPYVISSLAQWNRFASDSKYYAIGTYVKLGGYISGVTTTIGTQSNPFQGTFDGRGYTLAVSISETSTQGTAPFREISGATIKNLTVTGSVTGTTHAAGLVGFARSGSNTIENCNVSASVTVNTGSNKHCGGLVGHAITSTLNITNCIYSGTISNGGNYAGGLQGWSDGNTLNITNSLFSGSYTGSGTFHPIAVRNNNATMSGTISGAYYTAAPTLTNANYIAAGGTLAYTSSQSFPCHSATILGTTVYYAADLTPFGKTDTYTPDGTEAHPFIISTPAGWEYFCDALQDNDTWNRFSGKTVKLGADISVTRMAGGKPFIGTFDGDGHRLTLNYGTADAPVGAQFVAPFVETTSDGSNQPTFRNLTIDGTIYEAYSGTDAHNVGGLIGHLYGDVTIEHCTSNLTIYSTGGAGGFVGLCEHTAMFTDCVSSTVITSPGGNNSGFVGWSRASGHAISFEGCLFNGKLMQQNGEGSSNGGFIGWTGSNKTVTITNCLCAPAALATGETMASANSATFARGWNATTTATNSYYTQAFGTAQGKQARSITVGEYTTVANAGTATDYEVSGITSYGVGIKYNDVLYAGEADEVSLTLGHDEREYCDFTGYTTSSGTLDGTTLIMPDASIVITAGWADSDWRGSGTQSDPYIIKTTRHLNLLANRVNGTNGESAHTYQNTYFKLGNDIAYTHTIDWNTSGSTEENNFAAIGINYSIMFQGHFDGDGHTISGIRIYQPNDYNMGLFGYIGSGAEVKGVTLADTRITGQENVGGLVGYSAVNTTITNCHVTRTVAINYNGTKGYSHGGIVGDASGTVSGCTSSVQLTVIGSYNGAIAGVNRNVLRDNLALNATVPAAEVFKAHGSISGTSFGTLQRNYYNACTVAGVINATGKGCKNADVTANDGAVLGYFLTLGEGVTSSALSITIPEHKDLNGSGELVTVAAVTYNVAAAGTTVSFNDEGYTGSYSVNGTLISGNSITMPAENVTVTSTGEPIDVWGIAGGADGSSEHPYIITKTAGWDLLAGNVSAGKSYSGKYFQLGADNISISSMVGTSDHPFSGIFNGNGNTLVVNINETSAQGTAPFREISGATIKNLNVTGSVTGSTHAAGLVGFARSGENTIENSNVAVSVSVPATNGNRHMGGIVGHGVKSTLNIVGCVFSGAMSNSGNYAGGLQGWSDGNTLNITNSLFSGTYSGSGAFHPVAIRNTNSATTATVSGCYYTAAPTLTDANTIAAQGSKAYAMTTAPANLGAAVTGEEITVLTAYANGILFDGKYYVAPQAVTLADNAANDLSGVNGYVADVTLQDRTLSKSGEWNTLCLPFDVEDGDTSDELTFSGTPLEGAIVKEMASTSNLDDNGLLTLNFTTVTSIKAGKPYIVKWEIDTENTELKNPVFSGVTITSTEPTAVMSSDEQVTFVGQYSPFSIVANDAVLDENQGHQNEILMLGSGSRLGYSQNPRTLRSFRCHFYVKSDGGAQGARRFVLKFDEETTEVKEVKEVKEVNEVKDDSWYTLDGRKLQTVPTQKGVYIANGKKVVIK